MTTEPDRSYRRVRVVRGPFEGLRGWAEEDGRDRTALTVELFGTTTVAEVDSEDLEADPN